MTRNATAATTATLTTAGNQAPSQVEARAAIYAALSKIHKAEYQRSDLHAGAAHEVDVTIVARVPGLPVFQESYSAAVSVGADRTRAASNAIDTPTMLAYLLSQFDPSERAGFISGLRADVLTGNWKPDSTDCTPETAADILKDLRRSEQVEVRGPVGVVIR